jgi:hypothetical protein
MFELTYFTGLQLLSSCCFFLLGLVACVRKRPDFLLGLALASLGFGNFWVIFLGSIWLPFKIVTVWSLVYVLLNTQAWSRPLTGVKREAFLLLLMWIIVGCLLGYLFPVPPQFEKTTGAQGVALRPLVQLLFYASALSLVPLSLAAARIPGALRRVMAIYAAAVVLICVVAVYQFVALRLGLEFIPIYRYHGGHNEAAGFAFGGGAITRLYSLAGEPKHLGIFLTPFVVMGLSLSFANRKDWPAWWNRRSIFALAAAIDVLTFSSALLMALGIASVIVLSWSMRGYMRVLATVITLMLTTSFMELSADIVTRSMEGDGVVDLFYTRTVGRIKDEGLERPETQALRLLTSQYPEHFPVGFGLGMIGYRIEGQFLASGNMEPIDSGWVTIFADMGAIGVVLILLAVSSAIMPALKAASGSSPRDAIILRGVVAGLIGSCAAELGTNSLIPMMIFLGVTWAARGFIMNLEPAPRRAAASNRRRREKPGAGRGEPLQSVSRVSGVMRGPLQASPDR